MKTIIRRMVAVGVGVFLINGEAVYGDVILYANNTTDTGSSLNFVNGTTLGDEITLTGAATSDVLKDFSFEFYSPESTFVGANVQMQVYLYANNGSPPFNGYPTPNTVLYNSGLFALPTPLQITSGGSQAATVGFDLSGSPITVPQDFTLAMDVTGLDASDVAGVELFGPPTIGQNNGGYWVDNGSGWQLVSIGTMSGGNCDCVGFGAVAFQGNPVPEPASVAMLVSAGLVGLALLRRNNS